MRTDPRTRPRRPVEQRLRLFLVHDWVRFEAATHAHLPLEERKAWLIPPPNPAKSTDARYRKYADEHGHESWELDALEPTVLGQLVRDEIDAILDHDRWDAAVERDNAGAARLEAVSKRWPETEDLVG